MQTGLKCSFISSFKKMDISIYASDNLFVIWNFSKHSSLLLKFSFWLVLAFKHFLLLRGGGHRRNAVTKVFVTKFVWSLYISRAHQWSSVSSKNSASRALVDRLPALLIQFGAGTQKLPFTSFQRACPQICRTTRIPPKIAKCCKPPGIQWCFVCKVKAVFYF